MTNVAQWGQQQTVPEPSAAQRAYPTRVAMLSVDHSIIDAMQASGQVPAARDWTVYLTAEGLREDRAATPMVEAVVTYGTGATRSERRVYVPPYGIALHVVATTLDVLMMVHNSGLNGQGDVRVTASASPGSPTLQRQPFTEFAAVSALHGNLFDIPPFATSLLTLALRPGASALLAWNWRYRILPRGSGNLPLITEAGAYNAARAIPGTVDSVEVLPDPADNAVCLWWEIFA